MSSQQDWDVVKFTKPKAPTKKTVVRSENNDLQKFDKNDQDNFKHKKSSPHVGKIIQKARVAKKMSQKDLAQDLNVKVSVLVEYETGKAIIKDNRFLNRCQRVLGVYLQGKNIGSPL